MKGVILLFLGLCLPHTVLGATHSLHYVYTATSGIPGFPEFVNLGIVDGMQIDYYDSNTKRTVPRQIWMAQTEDADYWERQTQISIGSEQTFKASIEIAKQRFNQTGGVHTVQKMYGCEWDEETGATGGFEQYGYDGEDYISFDLKTLKWIAPKQQAFHTKMKWESDRAFNEHNKNYLTQICINWLKKYVDYGRSSLMRTVPPTVSLLQKTPSSPVTCHATGFYPSRVMVTWQKDGQELHEDVELGETLPNDDGTFQKSAHLTVNPEERKNNQYQCVVQVSGIKEDFIKVLTKDEIQTRSQPPIGVYNPVSIGIIIGVVAAGVALLLLVIAVVGVIIWKKKENKKGETENWCCISRIRETTDTKCRDVEDTKTSVGRASEISDCGSSDGSDCGSASSQTSLLNSEHN